MSRSDAPLLVKSLGVTLAGLFFVLPGCSDSSLPSRSREAPDAGPSGDASKPARRCSGKSGAAGTSTITVVESGAPDGGARGTIVHVPSSYDPTTPTMLVLNF